MFDKADWWVKYNTFVSNQLSLSHFILPLSRWSNERCVVTFTFIYHHHQHTQPHHQHTQPHHQHTQPQSNTYPQSTIKNKTTLGGRLMLAWSFCHHSIVSEIVRKPTLFSLYGSRFSKVLWSSLHGWGRGRALTVFVCWCCYYPPYYFFLVLHTGRSRGQARKGHFVSLLWPCSSLYLL